MVKDMRQDSFRLRFDFSAYVLRMCLFLIVFFPIVSCEDEHDEIIFPADMSTLIPEYAMNMDVVYSVSGQNLELKGTLACEIDVEFWNMEIEHVSYYMDGELIHTATVAPYMFEYRSADFSLLPHTLTAEVTMSVEKGDTFVYVVTETIDGGGGEESM